MSTAEVDPSIKVLLDAMAGAAPMDFAAMGAPNVRALFKGLAFEGAKAECAAVTDQEVPSAAGAIPVRVYRPTDANDLGVLIWYHGGGWVIGDLDTTDATARELATGAGCVVVSVDYRLAPEHAFPAAVDDAVTVLDWVVAHATDVGGDAARIAVGGDSAGGNLAAVAAIHARDNGIGLRHQLLVYPATDFAGEHESRTTNGQGYFLTKDAMDWFEECYVGAQDRTDPRLSPIFAESLAGVAPAHVLTAGFDPLRDEGRAYAAALEAAGVAVEDDRYESMIHGFFGMGAITPVAGEAIAKAAKSLAAALA